MREITGRETTIINLFSGGSFGIDFYQRDYNWEQKQLQELVEDLVDCFHENYEQGHTNSSTKKYGCYFLGPIIIGESEDGSANIVDGQQRLTSILILLIYINNLQLEDNNKNVIIDHLIFEDDCDDKIFKLSTPDRNRCMNYLYNNDITFNVDLESESARNIFSRYKDLNEIFPEDLRGDKLSIFIHWFIRKVILIEIQSQSEEDAYTIFETMNDRGLSLTPTEMLRGFLLSGIDDSNRREEAREMFKKYLGIFSTFGKKVESDFFIAWLRSKYSEKIRQRKSNSKNEDFEQIGSGYNRWLRNNTRQIGLHNSDSYYNFIERDFKYFANLYHKLLDASKKRENGLESVLYNSDANFTLQHHLYLASVTPDDDFEMAKKKVAVVADFIDCWLNLRFWNYKSNNYNSMQYAVYLEMKKIRNKSLDDIRELLYNRLKQEFEKRDFSRPVGLNQFTSRPIHRQLARFIDWIEKNSGVTGNYEQYFRRTGRNKYEIEHIWPNHFDRFSDEFSQKSDFENYRNQIGGLLLIPKKINASLQDNPYEEKLSSYLSTNVLAQSLHKDFYSNNPGFNKLIRKYDLPFCWHNEFKLKDLEKRSQLYCKLASIIWSPDRILDKEIP